jgi:dihydroorotate dehydrogenase electron transfer subunit
LRLEARSVVAVERVGPYALVRLTRGTLARGEPGQFFMLTPPGFPLPRALSLCFAPPGELAFLVDPVGLGTRALCELNPGARVSVLGPLGRGFRPEGARPLLVGGGIGIAPLVYVAQRLGGTPAVVGFRTRAHAEAAALLPNADVVVDPALVTDALPPRLDRLDVLACGPEPMLLAVARRAPHAQLAWEAPMACGFGACHGCVVRVGGSLRRLCVEGPVLAASGVVSQERLAA